MELELMREGVYSPVPHLPGVWAPRGLFEHPRSKHDLLSPTSAGLSVNLLPASVRKLQGNHAHVGGRATPQPSHSLPCLTQAIGELMKEGRYDVTLEQQ